MDKTKFKTILINSLGLLTTLAMIAVIYILLYLEGAVGKPDKDVLIEFSIITALAVYCKTFWYKSSENSVRTSKQYVEDRQALSDEIDNTIDNPYVFDEFISIENTINYNRYMDSKCKHLTPKNYTLRLRDKIYNIFYGKRDTKFHLIRYILACERRAQKINQLSASRITSGSQCQLIDDRNFARKHKFNYIVFGTILSIALFGLMSMMVFERKEDIDPYVVAIKMVTYVGSMIFNILSTIISATSSTKADDYDYMRRIYKILDRYTRYKTEPIVVTKIDYIMLLQNEELETDKDEHQNFEKIIDMEVNDGTNNKSSEEYIQQQFDFESIGFAK